MALHWHPIYNHSHHRDNEIVYVGATLAVARLAYGRPAGLRPSYTLSPFHGKIGASHDPYSNVKETQNFLLHLHLTFSGLMCILPLKGPHEHCPFTTRLRVLKL